MSKPRFDWYEKVVVMTKDPKKAEIDGELGAVLGRAECDDGRFYYAVFLYKRQRCWDLYEDELLPTGDFDCRETFYDGSSLRVHVDDQGRGKLS